jgi:hypothetical protein
MAKKRRIRVRDNLAHIYENSTPSISRMARETSAVLENRGKYPMPNLQSTS